MVNRDLFVNRGESSTSYRVRGLSFEQNNRTTSETEGEVGPVIFD